MQARSAVDAALRREAGSRPRDPALVTDPGSADGTLTWSELERDSAALADRLSEAAADRGDRSAVEVVCDSTRPALLRLIAALRTDIPVVLTDPHMPGPERQAVREELLRAGVSIVTDAHQDGDDEGDDEGDVPGRSAALPRHALVLASGGTTGRPKLITDTALRRPAVNSPRLRVTTRLNWAADQTQLVIGRLHHAAPLTFFIQGLVDGNRLVVPSRFASSIAVGLIAAERVNWFEATPIQLGHLATWLRRHPADLTSLRGVLHMSAPCQPSVKGFWIDLVGADRIFEIYGASEGIGVTVADGREWLDRPGTVGRGFLTQLRILDEEMRPERPGTSGLVFMRSLAANRPAYLRGGGGLRVSPEGFRSVGDRGRLDEDGYLYLDPRGTDLINVGGENVYPAEIERVLARCPGVAYAAVTGVSDDRLGARPIAFVVCWPDERPTEREMIAFCDHRLSRFKVPKQVVVVTEIPHTSAGKIDRSRLPGMVPAAYR